MEQEDGAPRLPLSFVQMWSRDGRLVVRVCYREQGPDGQQRDDGPDLFLEFDQLQLEALVTELTLHADRMTHTGAAVDDETPASLRHERRAAFVRTTHEVPGLWGEVAAIVRRAEADGQWCLGGDGVDRGKQGA